MERSKKTITRVHCQSQPRPESVQEQDTCPDPVSRQDGQ